MIFQSMSNLSSPTEEAETEAKKVKFHKERHARKILRDN